MPRTELKGILGAMQQAESFLLLTHVNPDGDAVGSLLAVYHLLRTLGKNKITPVLEGPVPRLYQWLPGAEAVVSADRVKGPWDLAIIVDVARMDRLGASDLLPQSRSVVVIDHHLEEAPIGDLCFVQPEYAATGEIMVELFQAANITVSTEAAVCAYVALATDTGGFRFTNTTSRSYRAAAVLLDTGVDAADVAQRVFDVMIRSKFDLLVRMLNTVQFLLDGRLAYAELTQADLAAVGAKEEDVDGLINAYRHVNGVEVAVLAREVDAVTTKFSLRSHTGFHCAQALHVFGGGGHAPAAGATVALPLAAARKTVLGHLSSLMEPAA